MPEPKSLSFIANARLKDVVGRDLINDDNVAIIELIKNAKDAGSKKVTIHFRNSSTPGHPPLLIIQDFGKGMTFKDIEFKWLNIAYSEKKNLEPSHGGSYAGNKGIGRFSCDRLGTELALYTKSVQGKLIRLDIDWTQFEVDNEKTEIGTIKTTVQEITEKTFQNETGLDSFESGTVLQIKKLRSPWTKDKLVRLRKELEKFSLDPKRRFAVYLQVDGPEGDKSLNGRVESKIFEELSFRTTLIRSEVSQDGSSISTSLMHDGQQIFSMREKNPYANLKNIRVSMYYLNQPAKAFFKVHTGYRSIEFGSILLFLNGFRVFPYGEESDDWLGLDRRRAQGQKRFLGNRELVGFIEITGNRTAFKPVSSREGLVHNAAFHELASDSRDVPSALDPNELVYGFIHKNHRKLEKFVVDGLDWDRIIGDSLDDEKLLDPKNYSYATDKQRILESLDSVISLRSPPEYVEELVVNFKQVIELAQDESDSYTELVDNLQSKFEGTSVAQMTPAEKRDLSKFIEKQAKTVAAKERASKQLEQQLETETKRRLFSELEKSTDVEKILKMHHQTGLLSGKVFKNLDATLTKYRANPTSFTVEKLVEVLERALFDVDKIRKVSEFASKASFNLATNRVTEDLILFIDEYLGRIQELSGGWNLKVAFENEASSELRLSFRPLEVMMLVDNLIDNAGKANARKLTVAVRQTKSRTIIAFCDDGKGLPANMKNADLFEKGITSTSGSGIGLFHARQIMQDISGKISIKNNATKGATITLEFEHN